MRNELELVSSPINFSTGISLLRHDGGSPRLGQHKGAGKPGKEQCGPTAPGTFSLSREVNPILWLPTYLQGHLLQHLYGVINYSSPKYYVCQYGFSNFMFVCSTISLKSIPDKSPPWTFPEVLVTAVPKGCCWWFST